MKEGSHGGQADAAQQQAAGAEDQAVQGEVTGAALLRRAHADLDAVVEAAYGVDFNGDEEKIVAHLFKLYAELAGNR